VKRILIGTAALAALLAAPPAASAISCSTTFPGALDAYTTGACVSSAWANALESKIGVTSSSATSSLDYQVNALMTSYGSERVASSAISGLASSSFASDNVGQFTNDVPYLTSSTAVTSVNGLPGTVTFSVVGTSSQSSITTSSMGIFLNLLQYTSGTDINVSPTGTILFVNPGYISTSTGLTTANFASPNISQWTNNSGYVTSTGIASYGVSSANSSISVATTTASAVLTFSSSSYVTTSTASNTYYLISNPAGYITTSTNNFGGLTGNGTSTYIPVYGAAGTLKGYANLTFASSTDVLSVGGNGTSSISGNATTTSVITDFNNIQYVPANFATAGCAGSSTATTFQGCVYAIYASMAPLGGGTIWVTNDVTSTWTGLLSFNINGDQVELNCAANTILQYTGTGNDNADGWLPSGENIALNFDFGNPIGHTQTSDDSQCDMRGHAALIAAGNANTATSTGIYYGGTYSLVSATSTATTTNAGAVGVNVDYNVNGFGRNLEVGANAYLDDFTGADSGGNGGGMTGDLLQFDVANNSGERNDFNDGSYTDPANNTSTKDIYLSNGAAASTFLCFNSIDDAQIYDGTSNGLLVVCNNHIENPSWRTTPAYVPIYATSSQSNMLDVIGNEFANDPTAASSSFGFQTIVKHGVNLYAAGNHIDNYGGATVTTFSDHSLNNGAETEQVCQTQASQGALTNIVNNQAYTNAVGATCVEDADNSYPSLTYIDSGNIEHTRNGNNDVSTVDQSGNWTLGIAGVSGSLDLQGNLNATGTVSSNGVALGIGTVTTSSAVTQYQFPYWNSATGQLSGTSTVSISTSTGKVSFSGDVSTEIGTLYTHSLVGTGGTFQQQQAGSNNYFAGNLSVGTSTANGTLYVVGSTSTPALTVYNPGITSTYALVVASSGNVGIGTSTPAKALVIAPDNTASHQITMDGTTGVITLNSLTSDSGAEIGLNNNLGNSNAGRALVSSGAVNGTTPGFSFASDTGTGLTRVSTGTLGLDASGTLMETVTNTGVGIGTASPSSTLHVVGNSEVTGGQFFTPVFQNATSSASTTNINWNSGNKQEIALGTSTTFTFSNIQSGGSYSLWIQQDASGSRTVSWTSAGTGRVQWASSTAPTLSTGANAMDEVSFQCFVPNVTTTLSCYGEYGPNNFAQ
jgi:uncharacterized protein (DUF2141 family)